MHSSILLSQGVCSTVEGQSRDGSRPKHAYISKYSANNVQFKDSPTRLPRRAHCPPLDHLHCRQKIWPQHLLSTQQSSPRLHPLGGWAKCLSHMEHRNVVMVLHWKLIQLEKEFSGESNSLYQLQISSVSIGIKVLSRDMHVFLLVQQCTVAMLAA